MKQIYFLLIIVVVGIKSIAQQTQMKTTFKKGDAYFFWGWNRSAFTKSNIKFKGEGYDFTLKEVVAHDRPTLPISFKTYIVHLFNPQSNYKAGFFIKNNLAISFGVDHMKYVIDQNQVVTMKGTVTKDGNYKGYHNGPQQLTTDFLTFEHTNGLNYINAELEKYYSLYHSKNNKVSISVIGAFGAGILYPKTDVRLLGYKENDRFHVSGYGINLKGGIAAKFFNHLMWRIETKAGFINMPDILVTEKSIPGRAKQHFFFAQANTTLGFVTNICRKKYEKK